MRFMMFIIPNVSETDWMPSPEAVAAMGKYNNELTKAGVLLALDGLHPTSKGRGFSGAGRKITVTDGPFTEAREIIGGYWLIDVSSREEAIEWAKRCPAVSGRPTVTTTVLPPSSRSVRSSRCLISHQRSELPLVKR